MKNFYFVIIVKENKKYYSYILKATNMDNLTHKLNIKNVYAVNICATKKEAALRASHNNACFLANNTYLYN